MSKKVQHKYKSALLLLLVAVAYCATPVPYTPEGPRELAVRSSANYSSNEAGLIQPDKLSRWLTNWAANKPKAIVGDLVILQVNETDETLKYVKAKTSTFSEAGTDTTFAVRVYLVDVGAELLSTRSNGLLGIGQVPGEGLKIDAFLKKYNIRPGVDFVLFAQGVAGATHLRRAAQAWLTLRYWGFDHTNLGILNGSVKASLSAGEKAETAAAGPDNGGSRITALHINRFGVVGNLASAIAAAEGSGDKIVDARTANEFAGTTGGTSSLDASCLLSSPNCVPTFTGRIAGAVNLDYELLINTGNFTLRSLSEIDAALAARGITGGNIHLVYDLDGDRSAVATFALLAVAGVPARWYANSYLEYGALNAAHPTPGLRRVPVGNQWRTDTAARTAGTLSYGADNAVIRPTIYDNSVSGVDKIYKEDLNYKLNPPAFPGGGGGGGGGGNPCGG